MSVSFKIKSLSKSIVPPIIPAAYNNVRSWLEPGDRLFDGDDVLFKNYISKANVYGEYGVGKSTGFVLTNYNIPIYAVDTSEQWVEKIKSLHKNSQNLNLGWIDVGVVGDWGWPISYEKRGSFQKYASFIWSFNQKPDLVLIDGRFRVYCFLYSLINSKMGTILVFDDYIDRTHYHIVEEYIKPKEVCGRQAVFEVGPLANKEAIRQEMERFAYVMD